MVDIVSEIKYSHTKDICHSSALVIGFYWLIIEGWTWFTFLSQSFSAVDHDDQISDDKERSEDEDDDNYDISTRMPRTELTSLI